MRIKPHLLYVFLIAVNFWILPAVIRNTGMAMVMMLAGLPADHVDHRGFPRMESRFGDRFCARDRNLVYPCDISIF